MSGVGNTATGATIFTDNTVSGGPNDVSVANLVVQQDMRVDGNFEVGTFSIDDLTVNNDLTVDDDLTVGGNVLANYIEATTTANVQGSLFLGQNIVGNGINYDRPLKRLRVDNAADVADIVPTGVSVTNGSVTNTHDHNKITIANTGSTRVGHIHLTATELEVGTTTAHNLELLTNNIPRATIDASTGNTTFTGIVTGGALSTSGTINTSNPSASTNATTGALVVTGGVGIGGRVNAAGRIQSLSTEASTSAITGSIVAGGGVGVGGAINATGTVSANAVTATQNISGGNILAGTTSDATDLGYAAKVKVSGSGPVLYLEETDVPKAYAIAALSGALNFRDATAGAERMAIASAGNVQIFSNATSTSTTTGALTVAGGVGIGANLFANRIYNTSRTGAGQAMSNNVADFNLTSGWREVKFTFWNLRQNATQQHRILLTNVTAYSGMTRYLLAGGGATTTAWSTNIPLCTTTSATFASYNLTITRMEESGTPLYGITGQGTANATDLFIDFIGVVTTSAPISMLSMTSGGMFPFNAGFGYFVEYT